MGSTLLAYTILVLLLAGCSRYLPPVSEDHDSSTQADMLTAILGTPDDRAESVDPLILDDDLRRYIDDHVNDKWSVKTKINALRKLMFAPENLNIKYDGSRTQTAMETFRARRGNCLSMTNLYVAAARHMNVDAKYQVVALKPTWEKTGTTMVRNDHINAVGRISGYEKYVVDFRPDVSFDENNSHSIADSHALALYYTNLGAESIIEGHPDTAVRYFRSALTISPEFADAWNNMGAALRRLGRSEQAEFSFQRAVTLDSGHYTAMSNLGHLYHERGDSRRENRYLDMVKRYRSKHPYYLFFRGRKAYDQNDYQAVREYLRKAINRKRDDPEFYLALSHVYRQLGDQRQSDINMRKAVKYREKIEQYNDEQELDLLIRKRSMSIRFKATRIPDR